MKICASLLAILPLFGEQTADGDYKQGLDAFEGHRYEEAARVLLPLAGVSDALVLRAKALIHLDRFAEAEHSLQQYLAAHPESADTQFLLGYVLFRENQPDKSLTAYTAAAALKKPMADDFKIVGLDYVLLNDYPDAIRWLERSAAENPADAETVYHLGRAYYTENRFDKSVAAFEQALKLDPLYAKAQNNLGLALAGQNKLDLAEQAYRHAIEMEAPGRKESEQPYINLADLLIDQGRLPEALRLLDMARRIDPKSDRIEQLRGKALFSENRFEEAESAFRAAIQLKPDSGALHYQLGRVLKRLDRGDEARQEFERSKALIGAHSALP